MTLEAYLYFSILTKAYLYKTWAIRLFSVFKDADQDDEIYPGRIYREPYGFFFLNEVGEKVKIEVDRKMGQPLVDKKTPIKIGKAQLSSVQEESIETTVGRLYLNLIIIHEPFSGRMPYINKPFGPRDVESLMAKQFCDTPKPNEARKPGCYYVDEYIRFSTAASFIRELSLLFTHSITKAGIKPAPGRKEYKKKLLEDIKARNVDLTNPIEASNFEQALSNYDKAYLKENDPSFGKFMAGKVTAARSKTYMTQGSETNEFTNDTKTTPIIESLDEGMVLKPAEFTAAANTIRYGSYARGAETVNGGVTAKAIMTAADTWKINIEDCGVTYGAILTVSKNNSKSLVGMTMIQGKSQTKLMSEDDVNQHLGKEIMIRSPQFCKAPGTSTCKVCAGDALAKYPEGQIIPLLDVSSGIMNDSLKKMHNTTVVKTKFQLDKVIT